MAIGETIGLIEALKGNGGSLPPVTSSDNGKVLAVKDGAWAADSNLFIVTKGSAGTADKTLDEVKAAVAAGKTVILKYNTNGRDVAVYAGEYYGVLYFITAPSDAAQDYMFYMYGGNSIVQVIWPKLPMPSASDNGSELIVKNGKWAKQQKKFIVTLTPTALDYSGTMDHTVAEITAAYEAGQEIWFKIAVGSDWTEYPLSRVGKLNAFEYPSFNCNALYDESNVLVMIYTGTTDYGTKQTYDTKVYALTPAS